MLSEQGTVLPRIYSDNTKGLGPRCQWLARKEQKSLLFQKGLSNEQEDEICLDLYTQLCLLSKDIMLLEVIM